MWPWDRPVNQDKWKQIVKRPSPTWKLQNPICNWGHFKVNGLHTSSPARVVNSLYHPPQWESRNQISAICQPHSKTDEVEGIKLILAHQHKADEYFIEVLPYNPGLSNPQDKGPSVPSSSGEHACAFSFLPSSPTGVLLLNSKGPHETCNQVSSGQQQLVPG